MVRRAEAALDRIDPRVLFAAAVDRDRASCCSILLSHLSFSSDEWDYLLYRRGFNLDVLLRPHVQHIVLGPVLIYKAILATFGMGSLLPYAVVSTASFLASVALLFEYLRCRVGPWLALAGTLPLLFMGNRARGPARRVNVSFTASMAAGIGALLAVERGDRRGDAAACGLLVISLAFSEVALIFALGVAVSMVLERRSWSRAYVIVVPVVLYGAWYAGLGAHGAEPGIRPQPRSQSGVSRRGARLERVVAHRSAPSPPTRRDLARTAWDRCGGRSPQVVPDPTTSRLLEHACDPRFLLAAHSDQLHAGARAARAEIPVRRRRAASSRPPNALVGIRVRVSAVLALVAGACLATIANLAVLGNRYQYLSDLTTKERGALAALELAGPRANPNLVIDGSNTAIIPLWSLTVGPYLSAVHDFGSPTYDSSALGRAPEKARAAADQILALAGAADGHCPPAGSPRRPPPGLLGQAGLDASQHGSCLTLRSAGGVSPVITLPHPGVTVTPSGGARETITLRRFATSSFPVSRQLDGTEALFNPVDGSRRPWQAQFRGPGPVRVCSLPGGPP